VSRAKAIRTSVTSMPVVVDRPPHTPARTRVSVLLRTDRRQWWWG
jgi:hypothetical protein